MTAKSLINRLKLLPHPEGGYFREVYRSNDILKKNSLPSRYSGNRSVSTSIYFMLAGKDKSHFHRIKSDEIWHFYVGSPMIIHELLPNGNYTKTILGKNLDQDERPQYLIEKENWFAAEIKNKRNFSLVGCTVAPGFDFNDFEIAKRKELGKLFPKYKSLISKFSKI